MNQAPSDNERRNPDDRQYHPGQRPELPTALAQTLVGGMTDQRLQNPRREPLSGELFLNFYLDDVRLELARATLARRPLAIEVGFGHGHFLAQRALERPDLQFVGFELRRKWCIELRDRALATGLRNLALVHDDARSVLARFLADDAIGELYVNFPDPWWKRKHQRRRLMTPPFVELA
ncbi:MAG: hypothetical protein KC609_21555, partial [Myxococcales bacterium]|nr:hypothetical protein [Myxococcales bacterium]